MHASFLLENCTENSFRTVCRGQCHIVTALGGGVPGAIVTGIATIGSGYFWLAGNHHGMDINFYMGEATPVPIVKR